MVVNNVQHYAIQQSWISSLNDDDNKLPSGEYIILYYQQIEEFDYQEVQEEYMEYDNPPFYYPITLYTLYKYNIYITNTHALLYISII